jgi:hypothetical protein
MAASIECVNEICRSIRRQNDTGISFKKLVGSTKKHFKEGGIDLSLKTKKERDLNSGHFYVMAYYDADEDFNQEIPIEVFVHHNFSDLDRFQRHQITDFLIQIFDAVVHELRHQQQSRRRNYQTFGSLELGHYRRYLSDPDELDAYALSIAVELLRSMPKRRAQRYLSRPDVLSKMKRGEVFVSPNLRSYYEHFGGTKLIKRLCKKVYKNLETIDSSEVFL